MASASATSGPGSARRKHIHLGFEHGNTLSLADPDRLLHGAEERLEKIARYFTFEPSIEVDEAVLAGYVRRAADLAILPSGARRALALERAADADDPGTIPDDWVPIVEGP